PLAATGFAIDRDCIWTEPRDRLEEGAVVLAAVEAVAKADPIGQSRCHQPDVAAEATARDSVNVGGNVHFIDGNPTARREIWTNRSGSRGRPAQAEGWHPTPGRCPSRADGAPRRRK